MSRDTYRDSRGPPPPRERSPVNSSSRYRPGGGSGGSYNSNFSSRPREFGAPYQDAPRGPRGTNDPPRGVSSTSFRGRGGFSGRNFDSRDSRDPGDRAFSNDRLYDGGDRWNPPRARSPTRRDSTHGLRQVDTDRARQEPRDGPPSAGSNLSDTGFRAGGSSFRGGYSRGRGDAYRGDRSRPDDRARPRSRDRSADSARLDYRERARNTDERGYGRDRVDDSYTRRPDPPNRGDSRTQTESRTTQLQGAPQNERPPPAHSTPPERAGVEVRRDFDNSRRGSALSDQIKDVRREPERVDPNAGRSDSQRAPRPASPPPAVPSFGFRTPAPFTAVTSLSWKNPDLSKPPPASGPAQPTKPAPTAPKALANPTPPSGPRAERALEKTPSRESLIAANEESKERGMSVGASPSPRLTSGVITDTPQQPKYSPSVAAGFLNPPSAPRAMASPQPPFGRPGVSSGFGRATSPTHTLSSIPTGPKAAAINASPRTLPGAIPTGPRADRVAPPTGPRNPPPAPKLFRTGSQTFSRTSLIPSKRDIEGFERERSVSNEARPIELATQSTRDGEFASKHKMNITAVKQETPATGAPQADVLMADVPITEQRVSPNVDDTRGPFHNLSDDEDDELDLADLAEDLEAKFLQDKERLEAKRMDLSSNELRPTLLFPAISRIVAMRAMINELSYRTRAPTEKKDGATKSRETFREAVQTPSVVLSAIPSPQEDDQDVVMSDAYSSRESSMDRLSTPDSTDLPWLEKGPPTPLSDPDPFSIIKREIPKDDIKVLLQHEADSESAEQTRLQQEFRALYMDWKRRAMHLDRQKEENEREAKQCSPESVGPLPTMDMPMPALPTPTEGGRRAHRFATEHDLQKVLEDSRRDEEERMQRELALREAQATATADREADIPAILAPHDANLRQFEDVCQARQPEDALRFFEFVPPIDDFTEEEDQKMRELYKEYPKVWHTIARGVGRSYKECINHYYASKWDKPYKSRVGGKRGRARGGRKPNRGQRSALVPAEDAETDSAGAPMVTESGRPKRAAAPVWPKDSDQDQSVVTTVGGKRNGKTDSEGLPEKPGRRKVKEKAPKKTARNQPLAARPVASPQKLDREVKDKLAQSMDLDDPWIMKGVRPAEPMPLIPQQQLYPGEALSLYRSEVDVSSAAAGSTDQRPRSHSNTAQRQGASSYWSVTEEQDFQRCLEYYGTDFQSIANHMGTKTHTMIKNHYQKFVNDGKHIDLIQRANEATARRNRGEDMGPPPAPSQAVKRHGRYDATTIPVPRNLAPNSEVAESDQSPPASIAVPFGLSPQFGPHSNIPSTAPRNSAALPTSAPGPRPHQPGPMLGYFKEDPRPLQNAIRPLIAPPEEPRVRSGPERIKTEFRVPPEHERDLIAQQREREQRELELVRRAEAEARSAQMAVRDQERGFHRSHHGAHPSQSSIHGMSPTSETLRQEPRQPLSMYSSNMPASGTSTGRNAIVDLAAAQSHAVSQPLDRRPQSPARHSMHSTFGHQSRTQPAVPSPTASAAAKEAPRRSNLMSLLNSEPEQEAPKRREPESVATSMHGHRVIAQSETPSSVASAPVLDRPFSRTTYPPAGQPHSAMSTPTHESLPSGRDSLPSMGHRDSWSGRQTVSAQAANSPHLHAQHNPPGQDRITDRVSLFTRSDYRQSAFGSLNGPARANPSPPPVAGGYGQHSRTSSYNHAHPAPPSTVPLAQTSQPPTHHNGPFGQREPLAAGLSPHLAPQHQPPVTRPEFAHHHARPSDTREGAFDRFRERDRERNEAFEFAAVRERINEREREREQLAREREYQEQMAHQQRFGHHTPPVNQPRYAPPQAVPERSTATPISHGGYPSQRDVQHQQAYTQRQYEFEQEQQRRDYERERSRQSRIHEAAAAAEERQRQIQLDAMRRQEPMYRREERYPPGMPPR